MAQSNRKFLGPNAGVLRDPTSNAKEHGRVRNPPRYMEMGGFSNGNKGFFKNDHKLASVAGSIA